MARPRIAVLGRFTDSASALRFSGLVSARALLELVWAAGGDPITLLPGVDAQALNWKARLAGFGGVLLPGGGDVDPRLYGGDHEHESVYDVDRVQDETDLSLASHCVSHGVPTLAICRGLHVVNVAQGGSLVVDMPENHRHIVQDVRLETGAELLGITSDSVRISCYHHQAVDRLGEGMRVVAQSDDGTVEAVIVDSRSWFVGVQWHPEYTYAHDPSQLELIAAFIAAAASSR